MSSSGLTRGSLYGILNLGILEFPRDKKLIGILDLGILEFLDLRQFWRKGAAARAEPLCIVSLGLLARSLSSHSQMLLCLLAEAR